MRRAWWRQGALATAFVLLGCDSLNPVPSGPSSSAASSGSPPPSSSAAPATVEGPLVLLTEVRFAPLGGDHAFVEISNLGSTPIDLAGAVLRVDAKFLVFDSLPGPLAPAAILLVQFDALDTREGNVLHAPAGFDLSPDSGTVDLFDGVGVNLDRVAWGGAQPAAVATGPGGIVPDAFEAGTTIARSPGATAPGQPDDWVVTAPADASPGEPNAMPPVEVLLPIAGAILEPSDARLDWYPVPGAASYRIQVASDPGFATIVLDTTTTEPRADVSSLAASEYSWRVQALSGDGTASRFSTSATFELSSATAALALSRTGGVALVVDTPFAQLPVPILSQHKDTSMLLLEQNVEKGDHAWDVDHGTLDPGDKADKKNCVLAMVAMVNHFYGGDLSQDRIGYQLRKDQQEGPEWDLNYGVGIEGDQVQDAFDFALGPGVVPYVYPSPEAIWTGIIQEIDAGRPIAAITGHHGFVITGYREADGKRLFSVNDPWRGSYVANLARVALLDSLWVFWEMPASTPVGRMQEPGVTADSDGDGVVDFDETERFKTDPHAKDSDGDKLPDKADIVTGVFDPPYGYATNPNPDSPGRDFDGDGMATQLDRDSDQGGCPDGAEDKDKDGHRTGAETWNFDASDDGASCGGWRGTITSTWKYVVSNAAGPAHQEGTLSATVLFEPDPTYAEACSGIPMICYLIVTDGSATWSETGSHFYSDERGTHECTIAGGGTYSLVVVPEDDLKDPMSRRVQLRIRDEGDPGAFRYYGLGSASPAIDLPVTTACPDQTSTQNSNQAQIWLDATDENADSNTFPKDARSFSGTHTWAVQGGSLTHTWTWTFEKVGD